MSNLTVNVIGTPVQQGSKTAGVTKAGRPYLRDANDKHLRPWRKQVHDALTERIRHTGWLTLDGPAEVLLTFFHPRPQSHYGTGRNAGVLKPSAPVWKSTAPDADKLTRAILDAITTSRAVYDDARIARLLVEDLWADAATGVRITIRSLHGVEPLTAAAPGTAAAAPSPAPVGDGARPDARGGGTGARPATPQTPGTPAEGEANGVPGTRGQEGAIW